METAVETNWICRAPILEKHSEKLKWTQVLLFNLTSAGTGKKERRLLYLAALLKYFLPLDRLNKFGLLL